MQNLNFQNVPNTNLSMINRTFEMLSEIESKEGVCCGCDLHHYLFNEDYAFIYTADAREACEELGVFECVELVNSYEKFNFGEQYTEFEPAKIANMVVYILGQEILSKSRYLDQCWDRYLTKEDIKEIIEELNDVFDSWGCLDPFELACNSYH